MAARRLLGVVDRDVVAAALLAALGVCELVFPALRADFHGPKALNAVLVVLIALPVAWRRRAPVVALVVYWVPAQIWLDAVYGSNSNLPVEPFVVLLVLMYSAAVAADGEARTVVRVVIGALALSELLLLADGRKSWGNVVPGLLFIGLAYFMGRGVRARRRTTDELARYAEMLEDQQEARASEAVALERDRIARELHDVIAHSVSVMIVQAGAGERLARRDPEAAARAFAQIREAGSEALDELRRLLGLLRDPGPAGAEPQPGLGDLPALLQRASEAGLAVTCTVEGAARPLPASLDLTAYRIVQEGLTNVRKHAAGASAEVFLRYGEGTLELRVRDDGGGGAAQRANGTGGHGLVGIRERVALFGGAVRSGPRAGGGFEIEASIPLLDARP